MVLIFEENVFTIYLKNACRIICLLLLLLFAVAIFVFPRLSSRLFIQLPTPNTPFIAMGIILSIMCVHNDDFTDGCQ